MRSCILKPAAIKYATLAERLNNCASVFEVFDNGCKALTIYSNNNKIFDLIHAFYALMDTHVQ